MKKVSFIFAGLLFAVSVFSQIPWYLTGNAGTTTSNFVGTTDNSPLIFRAGNQRAGYTGYNDNYNVAFGYLTFNPLTGSSNTAVGAQALSNNTSGSANVAIGAWALDFNSTGEQNVVIGESASAQGGGAVSYTVAIGRAALFRNTTSGNTAVGFEAGLGNTTGEALTATGFKALRSNTTGIQNTAHGYAALHNNLTGVNNTAMGAYSMIGNTTGHSNTAIGMQALFTNTTGEYNTAIGSEAMRSNTTGLYNAGLSSGALYSNTTGTWNTAAGTSALWMNQTGHENTAVGGEALAGNFDGNQNTAVGTRALWSTTNLPGGVIHYGHGTGNTAVGYESLREITTGNHNVGLGMHTLRINSSGSENVALGSFSLYSNTTGSNNTAVGARALSSNNTGSGSVAVGRDALLSNTTGNDNTAIGYQAMYSNISGRVNIANGYQALYSNTTGNNNVANGNCALFLNTGGSSNIATGGEALYSNTTGSGNIAIGCALASNTTGNLNIAIGGSMKANSIGSYNIAIGNMALSSNGTGYYNTAIGTNADVSSGNFNNATMIGYGAIATASNQVVIGNSSVTSIGGYVPWTTISDVRVKKNIQKNVPGLEFIKLLQPVTYNMDLDAADKIVKAGMQMDMPNDSLRALVAPPSIDVKEREAQEKRVYTGFIAQDVEKAAQSIGYDFSGVDVATNDNSLYGLRYSEFIVPLVKAVQELNAQNEELLSRIDRLEELVSGLLGKDDKPFPDQRSFSLPEASLEQNFPNPFNQSTTIRYILPETFRSAQIVITAISGRVFRQIPVYVHGTGSVTIEAGALTAGTYYYSLYVDGMIVDTKKMVVTN